MNKNKEENLKKIKLFVKKNKKPIQIGLIIIVVLLLLILPSRSPEIFHKSNQYKIENICNFATVKAVYHNVGKYDANEGTGLFSFTKYGYKKYWVEYDGYVNIGIDASKVKIEKPNIFGVVKVHLPKAEVLGTPDIFTDTMEKAITDTGFLTTIKDEDKTAAIKSAQDTMLNNAKNNEELLTLARNRAKELLEQYIENTGKKFNKTYKVKFIYE